MTARTTVPTPVTAPPGDETFTIPGRSWGQYVTINAALDDQPNLRPLFLNGTLAFVSPARRHERSERAIDAIIKAVTIGSPIEMDVVGSTTPREEGRGTGLEGVCAYSLGENVALIGGPDDIDLAIHPPPDTAIKIPNSNEADRSLAIYAHLGVPGVGYHDVPARDARLPLPATGGRLRPREREPQHPLPAAGRCARAVATGHQDSFPHAPGGPARRMGPRRDPHPARPGLNPPGAPPRS